MFTPGVYNMVFSYIKVIYYYPLIKMDRVPGTNQSDALDILYKLILRSIWHT